MTLHIIMACHNRRELTLRAVGSALASAIKAGVELDFTVFDDGSKDGTSAALSKLSASISLLTGDGSTYWAKSMAIAEAEVLTRADPDDWIVWLNDDVLVHENAFIEFWNWSKSSSETVYVGAMNDPSTGSLTYGGLVKSGWHPLRFESVEPGVSPIHIDSFNGNLVFVPVCVARRLEGIDGTYSHALADIDYGLRCARLKVPVVLLPLFSGSCPRNVPEASQGIWLDWKRYIGTKGGGNVRSLLRILRKNAPRTWGFYLMVTYTLWWGRKLRRALLHTNQASAAN